MAVDDLMSPEQAERIVNEYGAVLERVSEFSAAPESSLPYDKATIRRAIRIYMTALNDLGTLNQEARNALSVGYAELAAFVQDDEARCVREFQTASSQAGVEDLLTSPVLTPERSEKSLTVLRRIVGDTRELTAEFREFERSLEPSKDGTG